MIARERKSFILFMKYSIIITIHLYIFNRIYSIFISLVHLSSFFLLISHYTSLCNRMCAWLRSSSIRMPSICSSGVTSRTIQSINQIVPMHFRVNAQLPIRHWPKINPQKTRLTKSARRFSDLSTADNTTRTGSTRSYWTIVNDATI